MPRNSRTSPFYGSPHTPLVSGHDKAMAVVRSGGSGRRGGPEHRRDEHGDPSRGQHQPTGHGTPTVNDGGNPGSQQGVTRPTSDQNVVVRTSEATRSTG